MKRDLRQYARQTTTRLILGGILLLFLVGDGLIYWRYGGPAAIAGLLCLGAGLLPVIFTILGLWIMERVVKNANRK